jgi:tetratricopeptide (TPR) repeat protein
LDYSHLAVPDMAERQLTFKENEIMQILNKVYLHFKEGEFDPAIELLERALEIDFEYSDIANALKCANFWREVAERAESAGGDYERGEYYLSQWKVFSGFVSRMENVSERCLFSLKYHIFGQALDRYLALFNETEGSDAAILLRIGRCHKGRGNFESAISFLEEASRQKREDAGILAELADCYSLVNENKAAKVFFREAFFLDAQAIELSYLESPMIQRLVVKLRERFSEPEIRDWIPVYGTIYGLFNVKRELRPLELGKLKQAIYQLEKELEHNRQGPLLPRLINHYLWLIDHYLSCGEERQKIDDVLARIKGLDPVVYKEYVN